MPASAVSNKSPSLSGRVLSLAGGFLSAGVSSAFSTVVRMHTLLGAGRVLGADGLLRLKKEEDKKADSSSSSSSSSASFSDDSLRLADERNKQFGVSFVEEVLDDRELERLSMELQEREAERASHLDLVSVPSEGEKEKEEVEDPDRIL